jgi:hypothetical protein
MASDNLHYEFVSRHPEISLSPHQAASTAEAWGFWKKFNFLMFWLKSSMKTVWMLGYYYGWNCPFHSPKISRTLASKGKTESLAKCRLLQILREARKWEGWIHHSCAQVGRKKNNCDWEEYISSVCRVSGLWSSLLFSSVFLFMSARSQLEQSWLLSHFRRVRKIGKSGSPSSRLSVYLPTWNNSAPIGRLFIKFKICVPLKKSVKNFQVFR